MATYTQKIYLSSLLFSCTEAGTTKEHRLTAFAGGGIESHSTEPEPPVDNSEDRMENVEQIGKRALSRIRQADGDIDQETKQLASTYRRLRAHLDELSKEKETPENTRQIQNLQKQSRELRERLPDTISLKELGIDDPKDIAAQ